jgi:hypothetical protein
MSRGDTREEPHTLAGAYALDALDPLDVRRFEHHLAGCDACAQEIAGLRETAARLGTATAVPPPPGMKDAVLAAAARTSQHVPVARVSRTRRRVFVAGSAAAAAALIAVATVFGVASSDANQQLNQAQQRGQAITAVLTAHDATMMTGRVADGGSATVVMSHHMDALVFTAANLPAAAGYELWLVGPAGSRPAGRVSVSGHGMVSPMIATGMRPGDHLKLTLLSAGPAGGAILDIPL